MLKNVFDNSSKIITKVTMQHINFLCTLKMFRNKQQNILTRNIWHIASGSKSNHKT